MHLYLMMMMDIVSSDTRDFDHSSINLTQVSSSNFCFIRPIFMQFKHHRKPLYLHLQQQQYEKYSWHINDSCNDLSEFREKWAAAFTFS
jgi:hypothetical protein